MKFAMYNQILGIFKFVKFVFLNSIMTAMIFCTVRENVMKLARYNQMDARAQIPKTLKATFTV